MTVPGRRILNRAWKKSRAVCGPSPFGKLRPGSSSSPFQGEGINAQTLGRVDQRDYSCFVLLNKSTVSRETFSLYIAIARRCFPQNRRNYDAARSRRLQETVRGRARIRDSSPSAALRALAGGSGVIQKGGLNGTKGKDDTQRISRHAFVMWPGTLTYRRLRPPASSPVE
jgi:hypothetical protein